MTVTIAAAQIDPTIGNKAMNMDRIEQALEEASTSGAQFVVLPECAVTGYVYSSRVDALEQAEPVPGPLTDRLVQITMRLGIYAIVGLLERAGGDLFNTAVFLGPGGLVACYRKTHLLCLGVDRFTIPGTMPFEVHDTSVGRIGILLCYDLRFPEAARSLFLMGAEIIALPTNWPVGSEANPDVLTRARAIENYVYLVAADRVGTECGTTFIGRSQIVAPRGQVLAEASNDRSEIIYAAIDPESSRNKHIVVRSGEYEMDYFADRRPDLYTSGDVPALTQPPGGGEA